MAYVATRAPGRTRFGLSLPLLVCLLIYSLLLLSPGSMLGDSDTYWHIATGNWIIAHRAVPHNDVFSFSMPGAPWTSPEWLAEVFMAWLYDHFGWAGLAAITALCAAVASAMLLRALLCNLTPVHALIATVLAATLTLPHMLVRPHIFILPIFVPWVAALAVARSKDRVPSLWLVPLMTLWANLHSSYVLGLGLAALLAGEAVLAAPDWRTRFRTVRRWGLFGALAIGAALITPFGIDGLLLPFKLVNMSALSLIIEWQSPNFQHFQPLELWIMFVLLAALSLGWRLPPMRVGIVLLLLHMALQHARYTELLGLVAPLLLAPALAPQLESRVGRRASLSLDRRMDELAQPASPLGIVLAGAILLVVSAVTLHGGIARESDALTPAAALAAVKAYHIEGPVFNEYSFGGYLIFSGIKPFIDGRYFYGDAFIKRDYEATFVLNDGLPQLLAEYGISWTLLSPRSPSVVLLDHLPGWRRFYADDIAVVHVPEDQAVR
jgi:hypothetical protein